MKQSLSKSLADVILEKNFESKIALAKSLQKSDIELITPLSSLDLEKFKIPGRPDSFQNIHPRHVPKRNIKDAKNRAHFLHALANIELLAIELPALCLLRFGSTDLSFIQTQIKIIAEEARHFELLKNRLNSLNIPFGSIPAHMGLWDHAWRCSTELQHQIAIPCYLEARGLDVCPEFVTSLKEVGDLESSDILQIILDDEIGHVKAGMDYLKNKSKELNTTSDLLFEKTLREVFDTHLKSKIKINSNYRQKAGFSLAQIRLIETGEMI